MMKKENFMAMRIQKMLFTEWISLSVKSAYWNKGIGTKLVSSVVEYLIREKGADRIVMDPQTWNERAIHCYEKCGFEKVKLLPKRELHEGAYRDCWLMEYT